MLADHTAVNAGLDFRRYAMKPMPAEPNSSIAHVEGSGTPDTTPGQHFLVQRAYKVLR
jgi:hypothetical protein